MLGSNSEFACQSIGHEITAAVVLSLTGDIVYSSRRSGDFIINSERTPSIMPRYLIQASYTAAAAAAFVSNPQDRVAGVRAAAEKLGGKLESFDFCLGDHDVIAVGSLPDDTAAAALSLAVNAPG